MPQYMEGINELPTHMREGMIQYIEDGVRQGSFLMAVLCNDLMTAAVKADMVNSYCLRNYAIYLYNFAPQGCFGSTEAVDTWVASGGLRGQGALPPREGTHHG